MEQVFVWTYVALVRVLQKKRGRDFKELAQAIEKVGKSTSAGQISRVQTQKRTAVIAPAKRQPAGRIPPFLRRGRSFFF